MNGPRAIHFWKTFLNITLHIGRLTTKAPSQYESSIYMKIKQKNMICSEKYVDL
jgi:hypothetical protein